MEKLEVSIGSIDMILEILKLQIYDELIK